MLRAEDLAGLDERVVRLLRTGELGGLEVIGAGQMTCVLAWRDRACKRLPPFADPEQLNAYRGLLEDYLEALDRAGVVTLDTSLVSLPSAGGHVAYLVQPRVRAGLGLPAWIRGVEHDRGMAAMHRVLDMTSACLGSGAGIDATLQNWAVLDDRPVFLDVSTPMLRDAQGRDRLDPELFLGALPPMVRGGFRRFLVPYLFARHFDLRSVCLNLVGELETCAMVEHTDEVLSLVNQRLETPISASEVRRHRRSERVLWRTVRVLRRVERLWSRHVLRSPSHHLHPADLEEERPT
ncbi:MAG: DUF6206 family protein [Holophagales bacterium]|nr:DUF6206 family protein [Holophagales bacterium]